MEETYLTATGLHASSRKRIRSPIYYGWVNVVLAGIAMTATLPGRTHGLSLVTEPLLDDLHFHRVTFANINLAATIIGAAFAFGAGWLIDRIGVRRTATIVGISLAGSVFALSWSTTLLAFLVASTLIRGFGQSALSVVSMAMVGKWFHRRLGIAMALFSVLITIGFIATTLGLGSLVESKAGPIIGDPPRYAQSAEWRTAWNAVGWWILVGFVPLAWLFVRDTPESCGLLPDSPADEKTHHPENDYTLKEAMRTTAFWSFVATTAFFNVIWSGVILYNESISAEQGFAPKSAVQVLAILTFGGMLANFVVGGVAKRNRHGKTTRIRDGSAGNRIGPIPYDSDHPGVARVRRRVGNHGRIRDGDLLRGMGRFIWSNASRTYPGIGAGNFNASLSHGSLVPGLEQGESRFLSSRILGDGDYRVFTRRPMLGCSHSSD